MHLSKTGAFERVLLLIAISWPAMSLAQPKAAQPKAAQSPITRISFSRTPCYGFCPSYSVVLERDGSATWKDGLFIPRLGKRQGRLAPEGFAALAALLDGPGSPVLAQVKRNALKPRPSDTAGFSLSIERGDQKLEVEDFGFDTPAEFLSIEKKLDEAASGIAWQYDDTGIIEAPATPHEGVRIVFVRPALVSGAPQGIQETGRIFVAKGQSFQVTLPPGNYWVEWQDGTGSHKRLAKVRAGYFASIAF